MSDRNNKPKKENHPFPYFEMPEAGFLGEVVQTFLSVHNYLDIADTLDIDPKLKTITFISSSPCFFRWKPGSADQLGTFIRDFIYQYNFIPPLSVPLQIEIEDEPREEGGPQ